MKKILIISLFLFGQQAFSEVIPSDQLTGIYKNQGKTDTYIDNKIENKLDSWNQDYDYHHYRHNLLTQKLLITTHLDLTFSSFPSFILFEKKLYHF
jgi:hypothetical protein